MCDLTDYGGHERRGGTVVEDRGWAQVLQDLTILFVVLVGVLAGAKMLVWLVESIRP